MNMVTIEHTTEKNLFRSQGPERYLSTQSPMDQITIHGSYNISPNFTGETKIVGTTKNIDSQEYISL